MLSSSVIGRLPIRPFDRVSMMLPWIPASRQSLANRFRSWWLVKWMPSCWLAVRSIFSVPFCGSRPLPSPYRSCMNRYGKVRYGFSDW